MAFRRFNHPVLPILHNFISLLLWLSEELSVVESNFRLTSQVYNYHNMQILCNANIQIFCNANMQILCNATFQDELDCAD